LRSRPSSNGQTGFIGYGVAVEIVLLIADGLAKNPGWSLRGARRRDNPLEIQMVMRLSRFARNDKSAFFGLFTVPSKPKEKLKDLLKNTAQKNDNRGSNSQNKGVMR